MSGRSGRQPYRFCFRTASPRGALAIYGLLLSRSTPRRGRRRPSPADRSWLRVLDVASILRATRGAVYGQKRIRGGAWPRRNAWPQTSSSTDGCVEIVSVPLAPRLHDATPERSTWTSNRAVPTLPRAASL